MRPVARVRRSRPADPRLRRARVLLAGLAAVACTAMAGCDGPAPPPKASPPARPLTLLLVGDSVAGTLGVGLAEAAGPAGVAVLNEARGGCGIGIAWDGGWTSSYLVPVPPVYPCQSAPQLEGFWRGLLERYRPDVVVYAARVDTIDQRLPPSAGGRTTSILDAPFRDYLTRAMTEAVAVLSSTGAHVVLTTSLPTAAALQGNANDDPARWAAYARIVRQVAARSGGRAVVFDLGRFFGGAGPVPVFALRSPAGVQWRCGDGIHVAAAGGRLAGPTLFQLARAAAGHLGPVAPDAAAAVTAAANRIWPTYASYRQVMLCPD